MPTQRLYLTFHETFALSLPSVAQILDLAQEYAGNLTVPKIRTETGLGNVYAIVMPRYARGCGLIRFGSHTVTAFGKVVSKCDPNLAHPATLWLMHYHMSAPHGPGPAFWSHLVTARLPYGRDVSGPEIASALSDYLAEQSGGLQLQDRSIRSSATVFLGSYVKSDGLGRLGLLHESSRGLPKSKVYTVSQPQSPPLGAVAYALADYWNANYGDRTTVSLSDVANEDGFARIMWMDGSRVESVLDSLRRLGVLDIYRVAPPYQVARLWSNKAELLDRLYSE